MKILFDIKQRAYIFWDTIAWCIIFYLIFRYIILERTSYWLNYQVSAIQVLFLISLTLACAFEIKSILKTILKNPKITFMEKCIAIILNRCYYTPLNSLQKSIILNKTGSRITQALKYCFYIIFLEKYTSLALILIFLLSTRGILLIVLWLDVFYLNKIYLFYNYLWLSLLPLSFLALASLLKEHSTKTLNNLEKTLINIYYIGENTYTIKPQKQTTNTEYQSAFKSCAINLHVLTTISTVDAIKQLKYFLISRLIICLCFSCCWLSCIIKILFAKNFILW